MPGRWTIDCDNVRDWLWLRVAAVPPQNGGLGQPGPEETELADMLMAIAGRQANHRLILELDGLSLSSLLAGQLVLLHKRVHLKGGILRLCGLSDFNRDVLRLMGVLDRFQIYNDRTAAAIN
ncbi:MAG: hypothetical protein U0992_01350 [Planctomycetaceae bacterium]